MNTIWSHSRLRLRFACFFSFLSSYCVNLTATSTCREPYIPSTRTDRSSNVCNTSEWSSKILLHISAFVFCQSWTCFSDDPDCTSKHDRTHMCSNGNKTRSQRVCHFSCTYHFATGGSFLMLRLRASRLIALTETSSMNMLYFVCA